MEISTGKSFSHSFIHPGQTSYWRIPHTPEIDRLLTELIDLFISIRYAHPTLVQLELALDETGGMIPEPAKP